MLFTVAFRVLTVRPLTVAQVRVGAIVSALVWQALQWAGAFLLAHMLEGATATYGMFGIVLGLLTWIYLGALPFVVGAEINVVRERRLWPRSLLTPFTGKCRADRRRPARLRLLCRDRTPQGVRERPRRLRPARGRRGLTSGPLPCGRSAKRPFAPGRAHAEEHQIGDEDEDHHVPSLLRSGAERSAAGELTLAAGAGFVVQSVVPEDGLLVLCG
ncbi:YhjD/YihY/BrkB family envelope integrity protein [Actinomadura luteofluorescens]|uniref:YhjD/YihY/BrkB family envelope integrity protein n=1 Tax=Actinomadura luteofluorescens TaxID=46163 RepID=UPI0036379EC0